MILSMRVKRSAKDAYRAAAAALLVDARNRWKLTQAELGHYIGLSQSEVSRIESRQVDTPAWVIMHLLHVLPDLTSKADISKQDSMTRIASAIQNIKWHADLAIELLHEASETKGGRPRTKPRP